MLPDVDAQERRVPLHDRAVLIGRALDEQFALRICGEPGPAAAKPPHGGLGKGLLERVESAKNTPNRLTQVAGRFAPLTLADRLPEKRVVGMATAVVADHRADRLRHLVEAGNQLLDRQRRQIGMRLEGLVEVRHVGRVMLIVMDLHRAGVD